MSLHALPPASALEPQSGSHVPVPVTAGLLAAACLAFSLWLFPSPFEINGDTAWLLLVAERHLDGARLYVDVLETNPPMSVLLYLPPIWLSRQLGGPVELWLAGFILGLGIAALLALARLAPTPRPALFLGLAAFALLILPTRSFAQREHIAALALVPYLALAPVRWQGGRAGAWPLLAGLGAGLALCIKPHFALAPLGAHLALGLTAFWPPTPKAEAPFLGRALRAIATPETIIVGVILAGYAAAVSAWYPEFWSVMFERVALVYLPERLSLISLALAPAMTLLAAALALAALLWPRRPPPLAAAMLGASLGAVVVYALQGKGWSYHLLPAAIFLGVGLAAFVGSPGAGAPRSAVLAAALALVMGAALPHTFSRYETPRAFERELHRLGRPQSALVASVNLEIFTSLRRAGVSWAGRSASLWMTNGAVGQLGKDLPPERAARVRALLELDRAQFVDEALATRPELLAFLAPSPDMDMQAWLSRDPRLADLLSGYVPAGFADEMRLFLRKNRAGAGDGAGRPPL